MAHPRIDVGMYVVAKAPLDGVEMFVSAARHQQLDSVFVWDHLQDFFPSAIWDEDFAWFAAESASPHEWFEFQTLLGYLVAKFPDVRLGVGVTEPIRRHPAILAQAALTLAHLSQRAPILGLGAGERLGTEPYGLDFSHTVGRLEEALQIIRRCFDTSGPIDFAGEHFRLQRAVVDLPVPDGRKPEIWIAAHGPRMLRLAGQYGDGWYPVFVASPEDYATRLEVIRAAAREAGRDPDAITPSMHPGVVVAPTEEEAQAMLKSKPVRFFGLLLPDAIWQFFGLRHPFGEDFRGYLDILPETYDRQTVDAAIAAVPQEMVEGLIWGTPEQVVAKVRAFGEAGLRHIVPLVASAAVSPEAAGYSMEAMTEIAQRLRSGQ
jgi:phthiodiolone/phenolphthiodiolone dimycocerosates ketoreductase